MLAKRRNLAFFQKHRRYGHSVYYHRYSLSPHRPGRLLPARNTGPPVAYAGLLLLHFTDKVQYSTTQLLLWLLLVIILQVLDYFIPMLGSKYSGGTRWGTRGCLAGTIIGLFFMPWGIVLGPFLGAFIGELLGGKETRQALKSGMGSLFGFLFGTVLKCILCGYFAWEFVSALVQQ